MGTALALLYWLAALHSISFACTPGGVSPVWSATGIGIAGLKLLGRRFWPAVALGSLGLNLSVHPSPVVVLWLTLASTIEALLGASLVDWATRRKALLMESRHAIGVVIAAVVAPLPCAALGVTTLVAQGLIPSTAIWECFHTWWIADGVGTLIIVPGVVSLVWLVRSGALPSVNTVLRSLVLTLLAGATVALVFSNTLAPPFLYLLFPLLLLATVWFRHHGAHLLIGAVAIFMVWGWTWGRDVFNGDGDNAQLVHLQIFLCSLALATLALAVFDRFGSLRSTAWMMTAGWGVSALVFSAMWQGNNTIDRVRMNALVDQSEHALRDMLRSHAEVLQGCRGFLAITPSPTRDQWHTYVSGLDLEHRHPVIRGACVVTSMPREGLHDLEAAQRMRGFEDFRVRRWTAPPYAEERPAMVVTAVEPFAPNEDALGLDLSSEPRRSEAAERSRDTGLPALTRAIRLSQGPHALPAFLYYIPVYESAQVPDTLEQRRTLIRGWIYAPLVAEKCFAAVLREPARELCLQLSEPDDTGSGTVIFESRPGASPAADTWVVRRPVELGGQEFVATWFPSPGFVTQSDTTATLVALALVVISVLIAGIVSMLQTLRARADAIASRKTAELQASNRELVTARDAAQLANSVKGQFLATMSHEIRTPLNGILGFTHLLEDTPLTPEQKNYADTIEKSGHLLLALMNDVLDLSLLEAGKLRVELQDFDLGEAAAPVLAVMSTRAREKGIGFLVEPPLGGWPRVTGDADRVRQVLMNLVGNAVKFTASGQVGVRIEGGVDTVEAERIRIAVSDTGPGITPEVAAKLFQAFTQADSSSTRRHGGAGLGLAISKRIIELMGGSIGLRSRPGEGSTFWLDLKKAPPAAATQSPLPTETGAPSASSAVPLRASDRGTADPVHSGKGVRVLLAEDTPVNQKLAIRLLEKLGCAVDLAEDGEQAVSKWQQGGHAMIFMDCHMPVCDGFDATRRIRALEQSRGLPRTPIIALTASAMNGGRDRCLEAGMDDFLTKPIDVARLRHAVLSRTSESRAAA